LKRQRFLLTLLVDLSPATLLPKQSEQIIEAILSHMPTVWSRDLLGKRVPDPQTIAARRRAIASVLHVFREQDIHTPAPQQLLAKLLAGNWDSLAAGQLWRPWRNYQQPTWTTVWFKDVERRLSLKDRQYWCEFEACTGDAAGQSWQQLFSGGFLQVLLREAKFPCYDNLQDTDAGGLWFNCWLRLEGNRVRFRDVRASSTQLAHNRLLAAGRKQLCSGPFVRNGRDTCINCPMGRAECVLARHELPYPHKAECLNYELKESGLVRHRGFMTTHSEGVCLHCLNRGVFRKDVVLAVLQARKQTKEVSHASEKPVLVSPPSDCLSEGSLAPRFRPWHGDVWQKGNRPVPEPAAGHREVRGDVHPAGGDQPASAV